MHMHMYMHMCMHMLCTRYVYVRRGAARECAKKKIPYILEMPTALLRIHPRRAARNF